MQIQPVLLQAFASTPVRIAEPRQVSGRGGCAGCGQAGIAESRVDTAQPVDELHLSAEALAAVEQNGAARPEPPDGSAETGRTTTTSAASDGGHDQQVSNEEPAATEADASEEASAVNDLTEEEEQQVAKLKSRDREVRAHEQAHLAAAGPYATGGPSFSYQKGPDGRRYAVGGEVGIDTSPVAGDPEATLRKAQQIRAAALAPASPSSQDHQVAAAATQMATQARAELARQNQSQSLANSYQEAEEAALTGTLLDLVA